MKKLISDRIEKGVSVMSVMRKIAAGVFLAVFAAQGAGAALKKEISVAINAEPAHYDLAKTTATVGFQMVMGNVYERLVNIDENQKVYPELAETVETNDDHTQFTYRLRHGVLFHNGEEMKADDVVASMNRWISNGMMRPASGSARFEKVDDYTVTIRLEKPVLTFNNLVATMRPAPIIVPKSVIDKADPKSGVISEYIGTGPYMIDEIVPNDHLRLKAFDKYQPYGTSGWVGYKEAKTPAVTFHFVPDSSTRVAGVQFGEYDLAIQLPFDSYDQFAGGDYQIYKEAQGDIGMVFNKKKGIASGKLFRQAVNAALNCDDIMRAAYVNPEFYELTSSYIEDRKNFWYTEAGSEFYNQASAARAKELLAQAGYKGEPFHLVVSSQYQEFYNAAIVVERELKDAGINIQLDVVDWPTYLTKARNPDAYDAFITGFLEWGTPGIIVYMTPTWNGWSDDPKLMDLMEKQAHSTSLDDAKKQWEEAQRYCWSDYMPMSKFGNRYIYDAASSKVKDLVFFEGPHMWNVTVEE